MLVLEIKEIRNAENLVRKLKRFLGKTPYPPQYKEGDREDCPKTFSNPGIANYQLLDSHRQHSI
jgi:hypothetical protein